MSPLLPLESLTAGRALESPSVELGMSNPITGKTLFLLLPLEKGWHYEFDRNSLRANRHLILGTRMWVTRGEARFVAIHTDGARLDVHVKVRPWKPSGRTRVLEDSSREKPADERRPTRSLWEFLLPEKAKNPVRQFQIRCHYTERWIDIEWSLGAHGHLGRKFSSLLAACQCH